jgi:hypothetical protein
MWVFFRPVFVFSPSVVWFDFFNRVFGRFVTRGVQKRDKKIARKSPQLPKKAVTYLRHFIFIFFAAPLVLVVLLL